MICILINHIYIYIYIYIYILYHSNCFDPNGWTNERKGRNEWMNKWVKCTLRWIGGHLGSLPETTSEGAVQSFCCHLNSDTSKVLIVEMLIGQAFKKTWTYRYFGLWRMVKDCASVNMRYLHVNLFLFYTHNQHISDWWYLVINLLYHIVSCLPLLVPFVYWGCSATAGTLVPFWVRGMGRCCIDGSSTHESERLSGHWDQMAQFFHINGIEFVIGLVSLRPQESIDSWQLASARILVVWLLKQAMVIPNANWWQGLLGCFLLGASSRSLANMFWRSQLYLEQCCAPNVMLLLEVVLWPGYLLRSRKEDLAQVT